MDDIYKSAKAFECLLNTTYNMKIAYKKQVMNITLTFYKEDFFHLVGLHYLTDLTFNKNPAFVFDEILDKKITDLQLSTSIYYLKVAENYVIVKDRIKGFQYIENCIDSQSIVFKYIKDKNIYSRIKADFMFEVSITGITYIIFFKKRYNEDTYKLVSFFSKNSEFKGDKAYWLYKEKVNLSDSTSILLYERKPKSVES